MSGLRPFFITGANSKVVLNGRTMAFCTDLSCSVQILTQTPKVLGKYEGSSVEPLGYTVSGSFTLIRYAKNAVKDIGSQPHATVNSGNGMGNWNDSGIGQANDIQANPADLHNGSTFDIEVYQKVEKKPGEFDQLGVIRIRNARITQADFAVSKKSAATQRFSFVALYADEDSFRADFSGSSDLFVAGTGLK
jgi:hypothetical protein